MKRIIAILLCVVICFAFVGCKEKKDKDNTSSLQEVDAYNLNDCMKNGKFPDAEFALGSSIDDILKSGEGEGENSEEHTHSTLYEQAFGSRSTFIDCGDFVYYYENGKRDLGVSSIIAQTKVFGFETGVLTNKNDIKNAFPSFEYEERELTNNQMYFTPFEMSGCSAITYKFENCRIDFIFENDSLFAVNLVDTRNWTLT